MKITESQLKRIIKEEVIKMSKSRKLRESPVYPSTTDTTYDGLMSAIYKLLAANIKENDIKDVVNMIFDDYAGRRPGAYSEEERQLKYGVMPEY